MRKWFGQRKQRKPRSHKADDLTIQCVTYFNLQYPKRVMIHYPSGGKRNPLEAMRFKLMGVRKGVSDLFLIEQFKSEKVCYSGLWIELKVDDNQMSDEQKEWFELMILRGYKVVECRSFDQFKKVVADYLTPINPNIDEEELNYSCKKCAHVFKIKRKNVSPKMIHGNDGCKGKLERYYL